MKSIELNAVLRKELGKKATKALRKKDLVPCEIYGNGENKHIAIEEKYLNKMVFTPYTYYANINIEGITEKAIIKEVQFHPVTDRIIHVDFYRILEDKPVVVKLPVKIVGFAKGVKAGGKLEQQMRYIHVKGLLKDFPEVIEVNVDDLGLGKAIHAGDIQIPNLVVTESTDKVIVTVKTTRGAVEEEAPATTEQEPKKEE